MLYIGKETRFSEPDERRAIELAKAILGLDKTTITTMEVSLTDLLADVPGSIDGITNFQAD